MTSTMRSADPAADLDVSATSEDADQMLREILSTVRVEPARRRIRYVASVAGVAAAAAAVAVPVFWPSSSGPAASAYAVTPHSNGSVDVAIDFDRFKDPKALQRTLDEQHIRAVVLSGQGGTMVVGKEKVHGPGAPPECAQYDRYGPNPPANPEDPDQPVSYLPSTRFDDSGIRLRPDLLPPGGTYVIEIITDGHRIIGFGGDVAIGTPPSCLDGG